MKPFAPTSGILFILVSTFLSGQNTPINSFEAYYLEQVEYPNTATNDWHPDHTEVQGIAHDNSNWYFTVTSNNGNNAFLWRIPVTVPLHSNVSGLPGVGVKSMSSEPVLANNNFQHWGDPDRYRYNNTDYILVPINGNPVPIIACFRGSDLSFINYAFLDYSMQTDVGWCTVGKDGYIYTSRDNTNHILRYSVDWASLINTNSHDALTWIQSYALKDESGQSLLLHNMQGGEFSPTGELLYLVSGSGDCLGFGNGVYSSDGIHVFETVTWHRIKRSTNSAQGGGLNYFNYSFNNECACLTGSQTPEGLTIWDLDSGIAPNIRGQLHVIVNFFNEYAPCEDEMSIKHYGRNIFVDITNGFPPNWTDPLTGTEHKPFENINDAYNFYPIWNGARMVIKTGSYSDTGIYDKRIIMTSEGGPAIIGQ